MIIDYESNRIKILLVATFFVSLNGLSLCSAAKSSHTKKLMSEKVHTYLVEFDKNGWHRVYLYNLDSNIKTDFKLIDIQSRAIFRLKIDQALDAAAHMGTYTYSNQFIIKPNGTVTLKPLPVMLYKRLLTTSIRKKINLSSY